MSSRSRNMDVYNIIKPLIYISRIFGLAPFKFVEEKSAKKFQYCKYWFTYSFFWIILIATCIPNMLTMQLNIEVNQFYFFSALTTSIIFLFTVLILQIINLINGKRVIKIYKQIYEYDNILNTCPRKSYIFTILHIQIASIVTVNTSFIPSILFYGTSISGIYIPYTPRFSFIPRVMIWILDAQFIYVIILLYQRLINFNKILQHYTFNCHSLGSSATSTMLHCTFGFSQFLRFHKTLCDILEYVNRTYSFQILLSLSETMIHIIWFMYSFVIVIFLPESESSLAKFSKTIPIVPIFILVFVFRLVTIVSISAVTANEVSNCTKCYS